MENSCTSYLSATRIPKHPKCCYAIHLSPQKNMKQPGTKGWWGEFRKWHAVNESEQQCGALCGWQTDRSLRTRPGCSQSRGLASNSGSAPLFLQLRSSRQMWLNQYGSTITRNGSHSVTVIKLSQTFFKKALCDNTYPEYTLVCVKLLQHFQVCFPQKSSWFLVVFLLLKASWHWPHILLLFKLGKQKMCLSVA